MAKPGNSGSGRSGVRFVLMLGLLGLTGYNTFEVTRLRSEVARREHRPSLPAPKEEGGVIALGERFLAEARVHAARAQAMAERHNLGEARKEAERATEAARSAEAAAQTRSARAMGEIRAAARSLSERANALLTQIKNDAGTTRPGSGGVGSDNRGHFMAKREQGE